MDQIIPIAISVVALTVSFIAVTITRRPAPEIKEKKPRKKRAAKEEPVQA